MSKNNSAAEVNPEKFSMLDVNRSMYDQTLKRFRYSLQELRKKSMPKVKVELNRGRSLHKIWKVLKLEDVFHEEEKSKLTDYEEGMRYYDAHTRKTKHLKDAKGYRPKAVGSNCRIKLEYVEYLQKIL
jgi:tRNA A37 threonylcarbamoyladenosine dehydratase